MKHVWQEKQLHIDRNTNAVCLGLFGTGMPTKIN